MAGSKGDVELVIRAKNEATKNLDAINKSLKDLSDQQTIVGDTAAGTGSKLGRLGQQLQALRTNANNLKAMSSVATVLDSATQALARQRAAAAEAGASLEQLQQKQKALEATTRSAADAAKGNTDAIKTQDAALKSIRGALSGASQEQTKLETVERNTQRSLEATVKSLTLKNTKLQESVEKEAKARAAVEASARVTRAQQSALDSATRQLERRQKAVDDAAAKESTLRAALESTRASMAANKAAVESTNAALTAQSKVVADAKAAAALTDAQLKALAATERTLAADSARATAAVETQAARLREAQSEFGKLQTVVASARAALGTTAPALDSTGAAAGRAAIQAATLAARLAALSGAGTGKKSAPLGIDPAAIRDSDNSVRQLGVTIRLASDDATKTTVTMKELTAAVRGVGAARTQLAGLGEGLKSQSAAVVTAKAEWLAARAEVKRLGDAMKASAQPSEAMAAALGRAQAAASLSLQSFKQQTTSLNTLLQSMQAAGVGAGTLGSAEAALAQRLQQVNGVLQQGQSALNALPGVLSRAGAEAASAAPKVSKLSAAMTALLGGVNALAGKTNTLGGFNSQLVGMVSAAAGLYGIKDQLGKVLDAGLQLDANKARFASAFGSFEEGNKQLEYARKVAENLRLPINDLAAGYSKLALAAKGTALEGQGVRNIFEAFAQSTRVNQGTTAELNGVFTALTQIISKGRVQLEELSGQLGDRLPGALQIMADGLGISVEQLFKMTKAGELTSNSLLNMASSLSGRVAPALKAALEAPAAQIQNFENQVTKLRETIAGSGFLNAFAASLEKVGTALSTPEAIQGAKDFGAALGDMIGWLAQAPEHFDEIVSAIKALGIAWVGLQIASMVTGLYGFVTAVGATTIAVLGLDVALAPILVGMAALAAVVATVAGAFALWSLADWAYENIPAFAEGVQKIKLAAMDAWDGIKTEWDIVGANLKASFRLVTTYIKDLWLGTIRDILNFAPELSKKLGLGDMLDEYNAKAKDSGDELANHQKTLEAEITAIKQANLERQQKNAKDTEDAIYSYHVRKIGEAMTEDEKANAKRLQDQLGASLTPKSPVAQFPGAPALTEDMVGLSRITAPKFVKDTSAADEKAAASAAKKRAALEKSVNQEILGIRAQLEKKSADDLDEQIRAVPAKYAVLLGKLKALGRDKEGDEGFDTIQNLIKIEQQRLREADVIKRVKEEEKALAEQRKADVAEQKQMMEDVNTLYTVRKDLQLQMQQALEAGDDETYEELRQKLIGINTEYATALESALGFWAVSEDPSADAMIAKLERMRTGLQAVKNDAILTGFAIGKALGTGLKGMGDNFIDRIAQGEGVFESLKNSFLDFARSFLIQIAKMIIQQMILNMVKAAFGGASGSGTGAISTGIISALGGSVGAAHNGGTAGQPKMTRTNINPAVFTDAVRYHGGGEAGATGLRAAEVPAVLERGEIIRTEAQEAALQKNMNGQAGPAPEPRTDLKIVNAIDSASVLDHALTTKVGQQVFINYLRANKGKIQGILN